MKHFKVLLILFILIFTGSLLRLANLDSLPAELHRDETSIGYNAYSLLLTGRDEHGKGPWPLNFAAYGDYKLPGLIYSTAVSIGVFGLNSFAIRLPTAVFAILAIPGLYLFSTSLGFSRRTSLLATGLLSFSFIHISESRNAYEPVVGLTLSLFALWSWVKAQSNRKWFVLSLLFFALSTLFYNSPLILLPLLFTAISFIFSSRNARLSQIAMPLIFVVAIALFVLQQFSAVNTSRQNATIFAPEKFERRVWEQHYQAITSGVPSKLSKIFINTPVFSLQQFGRGYTSAFNPEYLFFSGGENPWHSLRSIDLGNLNPVLAIWILAGIFTLIRKSPKFANSELVLIALILITPLANALTIEVPSTNRLMEFHISLILLAAYGMNSLLDWSKSLSRSPRTLIIASSGAYLILFAHFLTSYFGLMNKNLHLEWNSGAKELMHQIEEHEQDYDAVYINGFATGAYSYFVLYTEYDPQDFQERAEWYEVGFNQVIRLDKFMFQDFVSREEIPSDLVPSSQFTKVLLVGRGEPKAEDSVVFLVRNFKDDILWHGRSLTFSNNIAE